MTGIATSNPIRRLACLSDCGGVVECFFFPWAFSIIVIEILLLFALLGIYVVFRASYPEVQRAALGFPHWGWGTAQALLIALGLASVVALARQTCEAPRVAVMVLAALAAIYGWVALGLKAMEWASWGGPQIISVDTRAISGTIPIAASARSATPIKADPKQGAKVFGVTCGACHGPGGEGVAQIAPSLKASEFLDKSTDAQVVALINNGRLANDPASKTNKAMPARGGNPFLGDGEVAAIVAFLRDLFGGKAGANPPAGAAAAPRWVVPPPPPGPLGLSPILTQNNTLTWIPPQLQRQMPTKDEKTFAPIAAALSAFQGMHLLICISLSMALLWQGYASPHLAAIQGLVRFACFHWVTALVLWAGLFPLLYLL